MAYNEPIAIVGMACRFPGGVDEPRALERLLLERRSAIRTVTRDRWDPQAFFHPDFHKPGAIHATRAGLMSAVDEFDAGFFGISPTEARRMDPQQRHVLESCFRAIEDAGTPLENLAGRDVAVIIGAGTSDYATLVRGPTERTNLGGTSNPGSALSIVSNRVSYLFDLRGPSFTVDTACSSSLTALHYACASIWNGSATAALAGGANSILSPEVTMGFSKGGYLSPDGECRAFSDHANGYVRSEGAGAVFLKPLSAALANRDRIYAMIRGTWINQDGRTAGMTVPSVEAQEALLRAALDQAAVDPASIAYLEAHGTGTPAGDPIEATAIGNVLGRPSGRSDDLYIGSVKTNLGHMECCAGMGGLLKLALTLHRRTVYANVNFRAPNPQIDFDGLGLKVATQSVPLPGEGILRGGVNSFGFGGANGHAVLESAPSAQRRSTVSVPDPVVPEAVPLLLSARSASALTSYAGELADHLRQETASLSNISATLLERRSRFEFRLGLAATSASEAADALEHFCERGEPTQRSFTTRAPEGTMSRVGFVYSGQGGQWFAMGRRLLYHDAIVSQTVDEIGELLAKLGWLGGDPDDLRRELTRDEDTSRIGETRIAQPCIFALQMGLTRVFAARGVTPAVTLGHSIGEVAAAVCAGALSVAEATRIVYWRSRCQASAENRGAMMAVGMTPAEARELVAAHDDVEIAAYNGPAAVTLAGSHDAIEDIWARLALTDTFARKLEVSVPFHCYLMDPIEEAFIEGLGQVESRTPQTALYSTVSGKRARNLDAAYWFSNIRQPVRYQQALDAIVRAEDIDCFVELGPHPSLMHGSQDLLRKAGTRAAWIPTLRRKADDFEQLALARAHLAASGVREAVGSAQHVELPPHPFERERFWLETEDGRRSRQRPVTHLHPHLGRIERGVHTDVAFTAHLALDPHTEPYLGDHCAQGHIVFPGASQLELVTAAAREIHGTDALVVEDFELRRPIVLTADDTASTVHRLDVYAEDGSFIIVSNSRKPDAPWVEHTKGRIRLSEHPGAARLDLDALRTRLSEAIDVGGFYRACDDVGLQLGPAFRNLTQYTHDGRRGEYLCRVDPVGLDAFELPRFGFHPALLDAAFHSLLPVDPQRSAQPLFLPYRVALARFIGAPPRGRFWSHAHIAWASDTEFEARVDLCGDDGVVFAQLEGLIARRVQGSDAEQSTAALQYAQSWKPWTPAVQDADGAKTEPVEPGRWLFFASRSHPGLTAALERGLEQAGASITRIVAGKQLRRVEDDLYELDVLRPEGLEAVLADLEGPIVGIVHATSMDIDSPVPTEASQMGPASVAMVASTIARAQRWAAKPRAVLITRGATRPSAAHVHNDDGVGTAQALVWGLGRVLMSEQPRLSVSMVDLGEATDDEFGRIAAVALDASAPAELALRGEGTFARILARPEPTDPTQIFELSATALRQVVVTPGVVDSVAPEVFDPPPLGPEDVEVHVAAAGLNFRDVVAAMNLLPPEAWDGGLITGFALGLDAAGTVRRVGAEVTSVEVGDRVIGFFPHCLATRAVTHERQVTRMLPELSMAEAAALPTPFSTADYALNDLARLSAGETILIHSAAGGVGTVAVQLATGLGARVIATTSTQEKREFLRGLGVEHIFGSRTPDFGDAIMELTNGEGVDVVLNSLSGRAMTESFRVLRPFGRFVEIGKTDVYRNRQIGLQQFGQNKSYFCLDVNRQYLNPKADGRVRLVRAMEARRDGVLRSLPVRTFDFEESAAALRWLGQGKHIGRVVVEVPEQGTIEARPSSSLQLDPRGVYVVTGGCAGFGLALGQWLVDKGATRLVLTSRSGLPSAAEESIVEGLEQCGATVLVHRADVSNADAVAGLVAAAQTLGRLAGVFHGAMVLDDGALEALDAERFARVLAPKADGAWHLHRATAGLDLDHFVLMSSIASAIGTPGQGNYAAANAYLDELAEARREAGLPATSVNWGVIDDVGVVARASAQQRRKILGQGVRAMASRRAFDLLEVVLVEGRTRSVMAELDARLLGRLGGAARRFDPDLLTGQRERGSASGQSLRESVTLAPREEAMEHVAAALAELLSGVVGLEAERIDLDASLGRYGLDSLMFAQLQTWVDDQLGLRIGMVRLMRGPSIRELSSELVEEFVGGGGSSNDTGLIRVLVEAPAPRLRIVCCPPMAMEADVFSTLASVVSEGVEVVTVELPTFDTDPGEFLRASIDEQTDHVIADLALREPAKTVIYGHSMGAYVALEIARRMHGDPPALLVAGAVPVPRYPAVLDGVDVATPEHITDAMASASVSRFVDTDALDSLQRDRVLQLARRDLWLTAHGRKADPTAPHGVPALLVGGDSDPLETVDGHDPRADAKALGYADGRRIAGEHLFIQSEASCRALLELIDAHVGSPSADTTGHEGPPSRLADNPPMLAEGTLPSDVGDLVDLLRFRASSRRGRYTFLDGGLRGRATELSSVALLRRASGVAAHLRANVVPGSRVALMHPPGLDYLVAFFGTMMAGLVPVPVYPPDVTALDGSLSRLFALIDDADVQAILTSGSVATMTRALAEQHEPLRRRPIIATDELPAADDDGARGPGPGAVAFLQYTSGSTRMPKGVRVTHANLLANLTLMRDAFGISGGTGVSWLPPYHDMGLIAGNLLPVHTGMHAVLMAPLSFLQRPLSWLAAMSKFRAEICGAPNFAYELATRRAKPEELAALDLSSWRVAVCGAEPVNPHTMRAFARTFAPAGFSAGALYPCYGLAEATLLVSGPKVGSGVKTLHVDQDALMAGRIEQVRGDGGVEVVSCGAPLSPAGVRIVSPDGRRDQALPEDTIGEVVVTGPCVADGYHKSSNEPPEQPRAFEAQTVRTGDLGFLHGGDLYVVGRSKDVIIVRGKKLHPHDLEATLVAGVQGVELGRVLAGGWEDEGQPRPVVLVEPLTPIADLDTNALIQDVQGAIRQGHGITVGVGVLERGQIPKTSSGKLRRLEAVARLRAGSLTPAAASANLRTWLSRDEAPRHDPVHARVLEQMRTQLAAIVERDALEIDVDAPLGAQDFDSLAAAEMGAEIEDTFGVTVPMAVLFEGVSLSELARRVATARDHGDTTLTSSRASIEVVAETPRQAAALTMPALSLFFFQSSPAELPPEEELYDLVRTAAATVDEAGFEAIWLPERHFHPFGAPFPNPSVLAAAIAVGTRRLKLRAGSVVLPLHHPVRVTEEWAMVDRLSGGRVGLSFTPGWNPQDFLLVPGKFEGRREDCRASIETVRALWRGEKGRFAGGDGAPTEVSVFPRPRQPELPVWLTCTDRRERFVEAGRGGFNVLTALLLQDLESLGERIEAYREARRQAGHSGPGHVTLAVHTHVAPTDAEAEEAVREPFAKYLASSTDLWKQVSSRLDSMTDRTREGAIAYALERYLRTATLIGSPQTCRRRLQTIAEAGVDEVACQVDFGLSGDRVLGGLPHLIALRSNTEEKHR